MISQQAMPSLGVPASPAAASPAAHTDCGDVGYRHTLSNLQIQMIAIGGAVGVGLFLGLGERLRTAGPGLIFSYLAVSVVVYLIMRALGEIVLYRPATGAYVSYAREFVSERFAHLTGWIYVTIGALAGIAEIAAIAVYVQYWLPAAPSWAPSLVTLLVIVGSNLFTAQAFGMIELGAASIKVLAIVLFLAIGGVVVVLAATGAVDNQASVTNLWDGGGVFPSGVWAAVIALQGVVFSFSAIEIVGVSAGEAKDPQKAMPRAINSVIFRIGLFYLGSVLVLSMLLPTQNYSGEESPFVTALGSLGITGPGGIMNFVVLTAALSGVNATLYAVSRLLRNLAANGCAPKATTYVSRRGVPVGALVSIGAVLLVGVLLIDVFGASHAFEIALGACAVFILFGWIAIFVSHIGFRRQVSAGRIALGSFRMPGAPYTDWLCLAALVAMFLWLVFDQRNPNWWHSLIAAVVLLGAQRNPRDRQAPDRQAQPAGDLKENSHAT
jgi:L-asparagine permease